MRKILAICMLISLAFSSWFEVDKSHSNIGFVVKHLSISNIHGNFSDYDLALDFNLTSKTINSAEIIIRADSIFTQNRQRDDNLTSERFFDAQKFKYIKFKSTSADQEYLYGKLTIKNITKDIKLKYAYNGSATDVNGLLKHSIALSAVINRKEFEVGKDEPEIMINDPVRVIVELQGALDVKSDANAKKKIN